MLYPVKFDVGSVKAVAVRLGVSNGLEVNDGTDGAARAGCCTGGGEKKEGMIAAAEARSISFSVQLAPSQ